MTSAIFNDGFSVDVFFLTNVGVSSLAPANFLSKPNNDTVDAVTPLTATSVRLDFTPDISGETAIEYTGVIPGILSPHEVAITP
jgi:hypothetical protein